MKQVNLFSFLLFLTTAVGCTSSRAIRQQAIDLDAQIVAFRNDETARIDKLNQDYREAADEYLNTLRSLADQQLSLDRDHDSEGAADLLVLNVDSASLPGKFADQLLSTVEEQRNKLTTVDAQFNATRDAYAANYQALKLNVAKLDDLHAKLKSLSIPDTGPELATLIVNDAQAAYNGVQAAKKEFNAQKQSAPAPASTGG